jgi:transcriptional regulator with XRE-family HTH domain
VATKIGVSWMTVHRWERSQRSILEENLDQLCELYDKPLRWFLTIEEGDLDWETGPSEDYLAASGRRSSEASDKLSRKIADAPASYRPMIEKVVEDLLDGMKQTVSGR